MRFVNDAVWSICHYSMYCSLAVAIKVWVSVCLNMYSICFRRRRKRRRMYFFLFLTDFQKWRCRTETIHTSHVLSDKWSARQGCHCETEACFYRTSDTIRYAYLEVANYSLWQSEHQKLANPGNTKICCMCHRAREEDMCNTPQEGHNKLFTAWVSVSFFLSSKQAL